MTGLHPTALRQKQNTNYCTTYVLKKACKKVAVMNQIRQNSRTAFFHDASFTMSGPIPVDPPFNKTARLCTSWLQFKRGRPRVRATPAMRSESVEGPNTICLEMSEFDRRYILPNSINSCSSNSRLLLDCSSRLLLFLGLFLCVELHKVFRER